MIARLMESTEGVLQVLCVDGTICEPTTSVLLKLLTDFKGAASLSGVMGRWEDLSPEMSLCPGKTFAVVTDAKQLLIYDFEPFNNLLKFQDIKYISTQEYAEKHNKSVEIVKVFCRQNRIIGAKKIGKSWVIPEDAPYPVPPEYQREAHPLAGRPSRKV